MAEYFQILLGSAISGEIAAPAPIWAQPAASLCVQGGRDTPADTNTRREKTYAASKYQIERILALCQLTAPAEWFPAPYLGARQAWALARGGAPEPYTVAGGMAGVRATGRRAAAWSAGLFGGGAMGSDNLPLIEGRGDAATAIEHIYTHCSEIT